MDPSHLWENEVLGHAYHPLRPRIVALSDGCERDSALPGFELSLNR